MSSLAAPFTCGDHHLLTRSFVQAAPSVLMFKQYDAPMLKFEGKLTEKSELSDWISSKSLPSLVELDQ